MQENIISVNAQEEIDACTATDEKVKKLLSHISGPLKAGDATGFYMMLNIMEKHGSQSTVRLAVTIRNQATLSDNKVQRKG